jgi:hypothetical protein
VRTIQRHTRHRRTLKAGDLLRETHRVAKTFRGPAVDW